ncbi:MAG: OmpA family protein [Myxococcales bacterium]|nr:OmpA family protein [Myxococcales bacterium]
MHRTHITCCTLALAGLSTLVGCPADAAPARPEPTPEAPAPAPTTSPSPETTSAEAPTTEAPTPTPEAEAPRRDDRWLYRHRPRPMSFELGVFGGAMFPSRDHELFNAYAQLESGGTFWRPYRPAAPLLGARLGFFPLRFLGGELEGALAPTRVVERDGAGERATLYRFGGQLVGQLPFWSVVPFVVVGGGALGTGGALGADVDPSVHFGAGLKVHLNDRWTLRVDVRDNMAAQRGVREGATHYPEATLGVGVRFGGRARDDATDSDGDGYIDREDDCPYDPETYNGFEDLDGCPEYDRDGDGFFDSVDACPDVPGVAPDGCPEHDRDGDGLLDSVDACPDVPGVPPDGCPIPDRDGDGFLDPVDACPDEPETRNGYQDGDGCPDELPPLPPNTLGRIQGIYFEFDKSTIKPRSRPVLDRAIEVLREHPSIHIEISGHTDSKGAPEYNRRLSQARADAVRDYLIAGGVDAARLTTRGAGMDEPVATNATARGRAKNRRIEFSIVVEDPPR